MELPKIKFRKMSLEENINFIKEIYFEKDGDLNIHSYTLEYFPELALIDKTISKAEIHKIIENIVTKEYQKNINIIKDEVFRYNDVWKKYNDKYFYFLSEYLNISWPEQKQVIDARIGLIPVFPRYLDSFSYSLSINLDDWKIIETTAHETLHFLWFEKWKELFPKCCSEQFESPHIIWKYSEMVVDPILNSKRIKEILNIDIKSYDSFYEIKDGNAYLMDNLENIYNSNKTIEEKIIEGFNYIKSVID